MQTLHTENFIEFTLLKYIFAFFSLCILVVAIIRRKNLVYIVFGAFVLFCIVAMVDFYRWNYNYGHHLDPNAAIKVPGMTYQPPIIGYKQLLNFAAYSIPDTGGILLIIAALIILFVILMEKHFFSKIFKRKQVAQLVIIVISVGIFSSCSDPGPRPVKLNEDSCAFCKMTITDGHFASQMTTKKGRQYVFDDLVCMAEFIKANAEIEHNHYYVADFCKPAEFNKADHTILLQSDDFRSPMGGNIAAFAIPDSAEHYKLKLGAKEVSWSHLMRQ
jgi:copper chaperone NosL